MTDKLPISQPITTVAQAQAVADRLLATVQGCSVVDILTANGIIRAPEVVELAAAAGLDLAAAATLLEKESGGGHNVWGHDPVNTGGLYVKGSPVSPAAYMLYRARRGQLGCQGVGPCQLTYYALQDRADNLGGCWDWRVNIRVGFEVLARYIRTNGLRDGFRQFNGSGPAAQKYATDAMHRYAIWQERLSGAETEDMASVPQEQWDDLCAKVTELHDRLARIETAWAGGLTDDKDTPYDALEFLKRNNVEVHQLGLQIEALHGRLNALPVGNPVDNGISEGDVKRIVAGVLDQLATQLGGGK
ncbi:MAG: hypothetical protein JWO67_6477 [Streptosporangiaceae bacterium]|nr:hypothetical protein [Streptosporangiaceae bacterium]